MIAALHGTTVGYTECGYGAISIETNDDRVIIIREETFKHLYFEIDDFTAALKEDCIEYTLYEMGKELDEYPEWFQHAVHWGYIYNNDGVQMFYDNCGEIAMSPTSVILRNFLGDLSYMEPETFYKYYDDGVSIY